MIVLWGPPTDEPFAAVLSALRERDAEVLVLDQRRTLDFTIEIEVGESFAGFFELDGHRVEFSQVQGFYLRPHDTRELSAVRKAGVGSPAWRQAIETDELLHSFCELSSACIINRPSAMASNSSKPYQTERIRRAGLDVPPSLITTEPAAVRAFEAEHGTLIYKSISGVRSIVSKLGPEQRGRLERLRWCPTQFQARIPGIDWRVHVVADQVFPARIDSNVDDYRYASRQGGRTRLIADEIPDEVAAACLQVSRELELPVAGIDLRCTPEGRWYCFEVNPSPGFTWYQSSTGQPISAAIAEMLLAG